MKKENIDAQLRLAEVMNDTPRQIKLGDRTFSIRALRPGIQMLIAHEAAKIAKAEQSFSDIIKQFSENIPSVIRVLTLAILNEREHTSEASPIYQSTYEFIEWETNPNQWLSVLVEVLQMLDLNFFFQSTTQIDLFRQITLMNKKKNEISSSKETPK